MHLIADRQRPVTSPGPRASKVAYASARSRGPETPEGKIHMRRLDINGKAVNLEEVPADTPLLWVLRDELGLTGTKFGCGMALCGACTVHLDGTPTRACVTPISTAA